MRKDFQIALLCAVSAFPLGLAMSVAPDYFPALKAYPGIFFWGGISITAFCLMLAAVIAIRGEHAAELDGAKKRMVPFAGMIIFGAAFLGCTAWYFWPSPRAEQPRGNNKKAEIEETSSAPEPNPTLLQAQIAIFDKVQQFFGGLDESGLRELFDFPKMLRFNVLLTRRDLQKNNFPADLNTEMNNYFIGGQAIVSLRYANVNATPSKTAQVEWIPGNIGAVNTSIKFIDARHKLADLSASVVLPGSIRDTLKEFDKTIQDNIELMFDVLNERLSHNPAEFVFAEDPKSPYYGTIVGEYATRFHLFSQKANDIRQEIRRYLGTR
jgi:hypothetical protein